jgi:predicted transposase YbfD/YdcC
VFASTEAASLEALSTWPNLHTVLAVESLRSTNGTPEVETEIRYFLSSCRDDPIVLGRAIRQHWAIENALHWVLDVTFREDDSRVRDQRAARNLAVLRRMAINLVGRDGSTKASVRAKRKRAAWNDDDMLQLLAGLLLRQSAQGRRPRVGPCR